MPVERPTPEELAKQLQEITAVLRRRARAESIYKTVAGDTLPYPQLSALNRLNIDGPATTADLARAEAMTPQSMGAIVAELETGGYVTRRADSSHGRRRLVSMTAAGRRALALNWTVRLRWAANAIAEQLDPDEQGTLADALSLLRRIFPS